jgi:hypothetical protein
VAGRVRLNAHRQMSTTAAAIRAAIPGGT